MFICLFLFNLQIFAQSKEGFWYIQSQNGKFLNVKDSSTADAALIILEDSPKTVWKIQKTEERDGYYLITAQHSGLYLTAPLNEKEFYDSAKIQQRSKRYEGGLGIDNQKWKTEKYKDSNSFYFINKKNGKRLAFLTEELYEDDPDFKVVQLDLAKKHNNQLWTLVSLPKTNFVQTRQSAFGINEFLE